MKRFVPKRLRRSVRLQGLVDKKAGVVAGPFEGMRYVDRAIGSALGRKVLGTYELEIEAVILSVIDRAPAKVVIVGAGEGYYAVGFAWRLPGTSVVAFEANSDAHPLLSNLANRNLVEDRVELHGLCSRQDLAAALAGSEHPFLLMDVEGAEQDLLDPAAVPELTRIEILFETHDAFVPGVEARLCNRFEATHDIDIYRQRHRTTANVRNLTYPRSFAGALATWPPEGRPPGNHWLHLRPRLTSVGTPGPFDAY